jgi:hypothetical protein
MVRVKLSPICPIGQICSSFESLHDESENRPLQTPPVIHISRRTRRKRPDKAMLVQTLRRVTGAYMQG